MRRRIPGLAVAAVTAAAAVALLADPDPSQPPGTEPRPATRGAQESPPEPDRSASEPDQPNAESTPTQSSQIPDVEAARTALPAMTVKGRAPMTGYEREAFGPAWADTDGNGCDTRNDILRRDLADTVVVDCVVMSGTLNDPYSGTRVDFERGPQTSLDVQVDHVVSLANAWQTGAQFWSGARRERFANDRRNLLAVRGDLNLQKRDGDAATWLPPRKAFRCRFVSIQILTKQRYGLWLTAPEKAAMRRILDRC